MRAILFVILCMLECKIISCAHNLQALYYDKCRFIILPYK